MQTPVKDWYTILVCPKCKAPVAADGDSLRCVNTDCRLVYPVRDGVPVMLIEEATRSPVGQPAGTPGPNTP